MFLKRRLLKRVSCKWFGYALVGDGDFSWVEMIFFTNILFQYLAGDDNMPGPMHSQPDNG